jgi:hypothetical protein
VSAPLGHRVYIISAGRPLNVASMHAHLRAEETVTWVVPEHDGATYREAGARTVLAVPAAEGVHSLPAQRNAALADARRWGAVCFQIDDDLRSLWLLSPEARRAATTWSTVRDVLSGALRSGPAHLAGIAPTSNPLSARHTITEHGFVKAGLIAVTPDPPIDFDTTLPVKEDYDYTCRHLARAGQVARVNWVFADFGQYTNRGGVVAYRTPAIEQDACDRLLARWPQYLKQHPKRAGELSFRPRPGRS